MHWPCGTACATIYRETGSLRWTLVAILLPAGMGVSACFFLCIRRQNADGRILRKVKKK